MGCADQAWESERVSPGISGQVLKCRGRSLRQDRASGDIRRPCPRGRARGRDRSGSSRRRSSRRRAWCRARWRAFAAARPADFLWNHVVKHGKNVGLLAEDFLVRDCRQAGRASRSSIWRRARRGRVRRGVWSRSAATGSPRAFSRSAASSSAPRYSSVVMQDSPLLRRRWDVLLVLDPIDEAPPGKLRAAGRRVARILRTSRERARMPGSASRTGAGSGRYIHQS